MGGHRSAGSALAAAVMRQLGAEKLSARESNMHTNQQLSPQRLNRTLGTILGFIFVFAVLLLVILNPDGWREFILDIAVSFAIQTVIASCVFSLLLLLALAAFKRFLRSFVTLHTRMLIMFFAAVLALFALTILFRRRVDVYDVIQTAVLLFLFYVLANPITRLWLQLESRVISRISASSYASLENDADYQNLLVITMGDRDKARRLIERERVRHPHAGMAELVKDAVERWRQDNR